MSAAWSAEFVNEGEVATISGNFFYEPLTVTFTGGVGGKQVSVTDQDNPGKSTGRGTTRARSQ